MRNYPSVPNVFRVASSHSVNNEATYVPPAAKSNGTAGNAAEQQKRASEINKATFELKSNAQQQKCLQKSTANVVSSAGAAAAASATPTPSTLNGNTFGINFENEQLKQKPQYYLNQHQQQQQQQQQQQAQQFQFKNGHSSSFGDSNDNRASGLSNCNGNDSIMNKLTTTASIERTSYHNASNEFRNANQLRHQQHQQYLQSSQQHQQHQLQQQQQQQLHSPYATLPRAISGASNGDLRLIGNRNGNENSVAGVINTISGSIPSTGFVNGRASSAGSDLNLSLNNSCTDLGKLNRDINMQRQHSYEDYRFTRIPKDANGLEFSLKRTKAMAHAHAQSQAYPCKSLERSRENNGYLWIVTPVAASISVAIVIAALAGPQWLFTEEKLPNSLYNGTANFNLMDDGAYITKYTKSSLWILCTTLQGIETYNCVKIDYFPKEGYQPDPHDSTAAIPYTVTKSCPFFLASGIALLISFIVYLIPTCSHQNSLYYFSAGIMFIVSGLLMLIGLIAYISILKSEIGSKLRPRSTLQPPLFKVNYGQSFFLFVFGFVATEFVGLLNIFLYISLQEVSYYSRLPCLSLANFHEKIKEGENPRSQTYKSYKHIGIQNERKSMQRMRGNGSHHQVHSIHLPLPQQLAEDSEPLKGCRKHTNTSTESNGYNRSTRFYLDELPTSKCNLHSRNLAKSLNELYTEPMASPPPPPPSKISVTQTLPRIQASPAIAKFADLPQEFPLTRSISTTTDIYQHDNNGRANDTNIAGAIDSHGRAVQLERRSRRNMATNTQRSTDHELTRNELAAVAAAARRRQQIKQSENEDDLQDDEEPQRLCGLKRGIRKTKDELFQEFCKRAGMRPKPKNIYYIDNEEEMLERKQHTNDLDKPNGPRRVTNSGDFEQVDEDDDDDDDDGDEDGFRLLHESNEPVYGMKIDKRNPQYAYEGHNARRASMFAEPIHMRKLNSNLSLHTLYPPDSQSIAYQKGFYDATRAGPVNESWPLYPERMHGAYGGSQNRLDSNQQLHQNRATLPRSFLKSNTNSQDSIASASLQALNNAYSASQNRLTALILPQQQQQQQQQHQQESHILSSPRYTNTYLHKSYDDLNATNYIQAPIDPSYRRPLAMTIGDRSFSGNSNTLRQQQPIIQWPAAIPSSPSHFPINYQIYAPAAKIQQPLQHPLVTRSISGSGSGSGNGSTASNGQPKFQRAYAFDEQRRPSAISDAFDLDEIERERRRSHASLLGTHAFLASNSTSSNGDQYDVVNGTAV